MQVNQAEITQQNQQKYFISGVVDFSTTPDLLLRASRFFNADKKPAPAKTMLTTVNLSKVTTCNSAALALMLEMVKQGRKQNMTLHFENLPETLLIIAKAYGVEDLIRGLTSNK